jgi:hypothetical protein
MGQPAFDERIWPAMLAQANANHATASALLQLVQHCSVAAPVHLLEPDHLESWFAATQDAHDLSQCASGVLHAAEAGCLGKLGCGAASFEASPLVPLALVEAEDTTASFGDASSIRHVDEDSLDTVVFVAATVVAPPPAPSNRREQLGLKTVDANHMGAILMTPPPRSRAVVHETPSRVALPRMPILPGIGCPGKAVEDELGLGQYLEQDVQEETVSKTTLTQHCTLEGKVSGEGGNVYRPEASDASAQPENFGTKRVSHPKGVCRPEASDAPSQPEGFDEVSQQDDRRQNVQRRYGEEGTEALVVLVDSKPAVAEIAEDGGRTGALGSPPPTEPREADVVSITAPNDIPTEQLPRPPEKPPFVAVACAQENDTDSGCQAMDIAIEKKALEAQDVIVWPNNLESQAAETYAKAIKLVYGCAENVPPDMKAAYANLARGTLAR